MGMFNDLHQQELKEKQAQRQRPRRERTQPPATPVPAAAAPMEPAPTPPTETATPPAPVPEPAATATTALPVAGVTAAGAAPTAALDFSDMPYRKFTCLLTPAEHRALDLLKIELSDKLDGTITKENLVRCAIHYLAQDCRQRGEQSPILNPLRSKTGTR
jgi:hypothetical protein